MLASNRCRKCRQDYGHRMRRDKRRITKLALRYEDSDDCRLAKVTERS